MDPGTILLFAAAALASLFMAWVIGAGSSGATPFAPAVGANAIPTMRAAFFVGILGFAGAVTQGGSVSEAVGSGLIDGISLPVSGVIVVLLIGAGLMAIGIFTGYPIATAFTVTGSVIGVGFALGGDPAWGSTPKSARSGYSRRRSSAGNRPVLRAFFRDRTFPRTSAFHSSPESSARSSRTSSSRFSHRSGERSPLPGPRWFPSTAPSQRSRSRSASGAVAAASSAGTSVAIRPAVCAGSCSRWARSWRSRRARVRSGLAVGPLFPLLEDLPSVSPIAVLLGGGVGILVGSWTSAPRMIKSISQEYASLGPRRSISTLVPRFSSHRPRSSWGCRSRSTRSS